jgi:ATP-dependent Clp protease ATP-binding subunit ClpA
LARGEITVIGATTNEEYRKHIEPDQAFTRRFEVLNVMEPDSETAIKMLLCLASKFENHHQLKIEGDAIKECVRLSKRYIKDRRLPDAAIDLLDRTMAAIKLMTDTNKTELEDLSGQLTALKANDKLLPEFELFDEYKWLNNLVKAKISPVLLGKLEDASQSDKFETSGEFDHFLYNSLEKLTTLAAVKR